MIGLEIGGVRFNGRPIERAAERAQFRSFGHGAARIRKDMAGSIRTRRGPASEGEPPHTHRGALLRRSIRFAADAEGAVIGARASVIDDAASAHELGGDFKGDVFAPRPFALPALQRNVDLLPDDWAGTIGE